MTAVALVLSGPARGSWRGLGPMWRPLTALSLLNLGADVLLALALTSGTLGVVAVLASLGPAVTAALAAGLARERLTGRQAIGAGLTIGGTLLVLGTA